MKLILTLLQLLGMLLEMNDPRNNSDDAWNSAGLTNAYLNDPEEAGSIDVFSTGFASGMLMRLLVVIMLSGMRTEAHPTKEGLGWFN